MTDLVIRATILLAGALAASLFLRRSSGAVRHAFWSVTLPALILLPALTALGPRIPVPVPGAVMRSPSVMLSAVRAAVEAASEPAPESESWSALAPAGETASLSALAAEDRAALEAAVASGDQAASLSALPSALAPGNQAALEAAVASGDQAASLSALPSALAPASLSALPPALAPEDQAALEARMASGDQAASPSAPASGSPSALPSARAGRDGLEAGTFPGSDVSAETGEGSGAPVAGVAASPGSEHRSALPSASFMALLVWLAGALVVVGGVLVGLWRTYRVMERARPAVTEEWRSALELAQSRVGLARAVELRLSPDAGTAMTGGLRRPVILLPERADRWSPERRDLVLAHELVHVRRHDAARLILGRVATALYWFNPLMWLAARLSGLAREQACDEAVVALGHRPSSYARHLMELAEPSTLPIPALAILERPQLEERLMAILRPTSRPKPRAAAGAALLAAFWAVTTAGASPAANAGPQEAGPRDDGVSVRGVTVTGESAHGASAHGATPQRVSLTGAVGEGPTLSGAVVERHTLSVGEGPALSVVENPTLSVVEGPTLSGVEGHTLSGSAALATALSQERSCWVDGMRGNFSGTFSITSSDAGDRLTERYGTSDGDRVIQTRVDGMPVCLRAHGPVEFGEGDASIASIGQGGWVILAARSDDGLLELEMLPGEGDFIHRLSIDGSRQESFGAAERQWRDAMLQVMADRWQVARLRGEVSSLRGRISSIRGQESSLRGRISSLNARISSLRSARRATESEDTRARLDTEIRDVEADIARVESEIAEWDAAARVVEMEAEIAAYDADARIAEVARELDEDGTLRRIREIEDEIAAYDADARVREVEREIVEMEVDERILEIEAEIEALDAERRIERLEAPMEAHVDALRDATTRVLRSPRQS
jgi:beta-lactamase regulating signal transducer with metallopeptidase domain